MTMGSGIKGKDKNNASDKDHALSDNINSQIHLQYFPQGSLLLKYFLWCLPTL